MLVTARTDRGETSLRRERDRSGDRSTVATTGFLGDVRGSVALTFAMVAPVLLVGIACAIDYSRATTGRDMMQSAVDAAALAGTGTFRTSLGQPTDQRREAAAKAARAALDSRKPDLERIGLQPGEPAIEADPAEATVLVRLPGAISGALGGFSPVARMGVSAQAQARALAEAQPVCILSLNPSADVGIMFSGLGDLEADGCAVWSNATGARSFGFSGMGRARGKRFCAAGGIDRTGRYQVTPTPEERCPPARNPLASWTPPPDRACDYDTKGETTTGVNLTLKPGVYCNGLKVTGLTIDLERGDYIIKDGPLILTAVTAIKGQGVGFYLTGRDATARINGTAAVNLSAPTSGPLEGVVIAQDPRSAPGQLSEVTGTVELMVDGVLYFPTQALRYQGITKTDAKAPTTTLIADRIEIGGDALLKVQPPPPGRSRHTPVTEAALTRLVLDR